MSWGSASNSDLPTSELVRIQRAIAAIMLILLLFVAARVWCLEGLVLPSSIVGASMAGNLKGDHFHVTCVDCGHEFACDAHGVPGSHEVACPNCGYASNPLVPADLRPGDQVLIDHWVYLLGRPERGDVVAFTHADDENPRVVKRIVGLPREQIAIRRGDVIVDGHPWRKNLPQLRQVAMLVHDQKLQPRRTENATPHWQPASPKSNWTERDGAFIYSGKRPPGGLNFDWLSFQYYRRLTAPTPHDKIMPIQDDDPYNHGGARELNDVHDVLLTCRASIAKYGCLVFAAVDGGDRFEVHMCHDEQKLKLFQNGVEQKVQFLPHRQYDEPIAIEFALCDQQVLFGMDGREILRHAYTRANQEAPQQKPQLQIGAAGARIRISQARVLRDIYYLEPGNTSAPWHADERVPAGHYLVLGDNPTISTDSRQWPHPEVSRTNVLGRVTQPFWSVQ
jgi:ribosomal protein S27E